MKINKLLIFLLLFIISFKNGIASNAETVAIIPFFKDKNVKERDYIAFYKQFYKTVNNQYHINLLPQESVIKTIGKTNFKNKNYSAKEVLEIARKLKVDKIIYGISGVHSFYKYNQYNERLYCNIAVIDVNQQVVVNKINWNVSTNRNIMSFAESAAKRLLWLTPNIYPIKTSIISNRKRLRLSRSYFSSDLRRYFSTLNFPETTEIHEIDLKIAEKNELAPTGLLGCVTLVGWIFLPFYQTDAKIQITVEVKYLSRKGIKKKKFFDEFYANEHFHLMRDEKTRFGNTDVGYKKVKRTIYQQIKESQELFFTKKNSI